MTQKSIVLAASPNYPDIGTVGSDPDSLGKNIDMISQALDIYQRNTKNLNDSFIRLGDLVDLGIVTLVGRRLISTALTGNYTVASLPAPASVEVGTRAFVTDATSTTFLAAAVGGGANKVPVVSNGTAWVVG